MPEVCNLIGSRPHRRDKYGGRGGNATEGRVERPHRPLTPVAHQRPREPRVTASSKGLMCPGDLAAWTPTQREPSEVIAASVLSVLFCGWMWNNDRVFHSLLAGAFVAVPFIVWLAYARRSRKRRQTSPQWNTGRTDLPPRARQCRRPGDHLKGLFQQKYECTYQNTTLEGTCKFAISGLIHYYSRANPSTKPRSNREVS
jgi:hypothetical protein